MADHITIKIEGVKELQNTFKLLSKDMEEILADATTDGGTIVKDYSVGHVHVVTGWLRKHIDVRNVIKSENKVEVQVGVSLTEVPYAEIEEFRSGLLGGTPHSYLRTSLDYNEKEVVAAIESKIKQRLSRYK